MTTQQKGQPGRNVGQKEEPKGMEPSAILDELGEVMAAQNRLISMLSLEEMSFKEKAMFVGIMVGSFPSLQKAQKMMADITGVQT